MLDSWFGGDGSIFAATVLLVFSTVVAAIDVLGLHLWKCRLYSRPESFYEHQVHTAHAAFAALAVYLLFVHNLGGPRLWLATAVVGIWFAVELVDLYCEKESRAEQGGLSSFEYALHVVISGARFSFIALILASKPEGAWAPEASAVLSPPYPAVTSWLGVGIAIGGGLIVLLHLWLMLPRFRDTTGS